MSTPIACRAAVLPRLTWLANFAAAASRLANGSACDTGSALFVCCTTTSFSRARGLRASALVGAALLAAVAADQRADVADHHPDQQEDQQHHDQRRAGADEEDVEVGVGGVLKRDDDR